MRNRPKKKSNRVRRLVWTLLLAALCTSGARAQGADPTVAPVRVPREMPVDLLHVDADVLIRERGWDVSLRATAIRTDWNTDSLDLSGPGLRIDSVEVVPVGQGDSVAIRVRYHVPVGYALRSTGDPCCTWTWSPRTGGAGWLPFPAGTADRFTARIRFDGAPVIAGGLLQAPGDSILALYDHPVHPGQLLAVTGNPGTTVRIGRFIVHAPTGAVDRVPGFAATLEAAYGFMERETGFAQPMDSVQVVFVDVGPEAEEAGAGLVLADPSLLYGSGAAPDFRTALLAARLWAGGTLVPAAWTDIWATEALAHHLAVRFIREIRGEGAAWAVLSDLRDAYLQESGRYRRPLVWDRWSHPADLVDAHASGRGVWVLRQLEGILGGDVVRTAIRRLFREPGQIYTEDLQKVLEDASGRPLASFFDAWVGSAGHPVMRMGSVFHRSREVIDVTIEQLQKGPLVPLAFPIETRLAWLSLAGDGAVEASLDAPSVTVEIPTRLEPRYIEPDPDGTILFEIHAERSLSSRTAILRSGSLPARSRAARALSETPNDPALPLAMRLALEQEAEPVVRRDIVQAATRIRPSSSLVQLVTRALQDSDPGVRQHGLRLAAGFHDRPDLADRVAGIAANDTVYVVQAAAVEALAAMGAADADYYARAALITDSDGDVIRAAGFRALLDLDTPQADLRAEFLAHTKPELPVSRILAALPAAVRLENHRATSTRLRELLRHPHFRVRELAARAAATHLDPDAIRTVIDVERDPVVRSSLEYALRGVRAGN